MRKFTFSFKSLLVACGLLLGSANAWGEDVASHDFNSSTTPFTIHDGARIGVTYEEHVADGGDYYAKYSCIRSSGKAFAYYNFSSSVADAALVAVEFDCYFKSGSWQSFISLADANYHTADVLGIGNVNYNKTGAIFNLGQHRAKVSGKNENHFGINSAHVSTLDETCLDKWIHVSITVDNASRKVSYTIKNADQTSTLKSETNINFLDATAQRCSQVDIYLGNNTDNFVYIDNLVITKTVSDVSHNYTINAVAGSSTIKTNIKSGEATEGASYTVSGLPYVVEKDGNFYVLDDANVTNNGVTFTMLKADQTKAVNYTLDESIVYFKEGESFAGANATTLDSRASGGGYPDYFRNNTSNAVTTLNKGVYRVETYIWNRTDKEINLYKTSKDNANILASLTGSGSQSKNFLIDANSTATVLGCVNNSCCFDYILIRKLYDVEGEVVGAVDYTTPYWSKWNTTPVWINAGETGYYKIKNHNNGANTYENWYLYAANESSENKTVLRADKHVNIGSGTLVWEDYNEGTVVADLSDATVDISVSLADAGNGTYTLTSTAIVTKADGTEMSPYIYTQTGYTENKLKLYVSVEKSWLEVLAQGTIVNETLNTNMSGYKTFYNAISNYKVDANTTIYKAAEPSAGKVVLTEVDGDVIKAGQPVILHTSETSIVITPTDATSTGDYTGNALQVVDGTVSGKYVLGYTEANKFGFYYYTATLPAGYIYLDGDAPSPASPDVKVFSVVTDGTATGVDAPVAAETAEEDGVLYNTAGQIVNKDYKGIVIKNGKKYLNK